MRNERMTFDDIARELHVSKSTVSRALSGKGRISSETRERIVSFFEEHAAHTAKEAMKVRRTGEAAGNTITGNLGVVIPQEVYQNSYPFFHDCLLGICESAALMDYNVIVVTETAEDDSQVKKLIEHHKVDGMILTRVREEDKTVSYLLEQNIPVGVTGGYGNAEVMQVECDNKKAAESLTSLLIGRGYQRFALVIENLDVLVNRDRYQGVQEALQKHKLAETVYPGVCKNELIDAMVTDMMSKQVECILCGDDVICARVYKRLQAAGYRIPEDIAVASFYNSVNLDGFIPAVTAVHIPAVQIGNEIGKQMIQKLQGLSCNQKTQLDYEILLRRSTQEGR